MTTMPTPDIDVAMSRRGFLTGALLAGAGAMAFSPEILAQALTSGKTPEEIQGWGVDPGEVHIGANENPLGPSPRAVEAVVQSLYKSNRYGFNSFDLAMPLMRQHRIGRKWQAGMREQQGDFFGMLSASPIIISPGSSMILQTLLTSQMSQGGHLVESSSAYGHLSMAAGWFQRSGVPVEVTRVPLGPEYRVDLDAIRDAIIPGKTKLVGVTNPNNPTGTIVDAAQLKQFVASVPEDVIVHVDEAYFEFIREPDYPSAISWALDHENVIVTRTFSKIYGLAGMRMGYAVCNPKLTGRLLPFIGFPDLNLSSMSLAGAIAAMDDEDHVRRTKQVTDEGKDYLMKEAEAMGLESVPSHSNFMLINFDKDTKAIVDALAEKKVFVRYPGDAPPLGDWGLPTSIRVSIGTAEELEAFVNTLKAVMKTKS